MYIGTCVWLCIGVCVYKSMCMYVCIMHTCSTCIHVVHASCIMHVLLCMYLYHMYLCMYLQVPAYVCMHVLMYVWASAANAKLNIHLHLHVTVKRVPAFSNDSSVRIAASHVKQQYSFASLPDTMQQLHWFSLSKPELAGAPNEADISIMACCSLFHWHKSSSEGSSQL